LVPFSETWPDWIFERTLRDCCITGEPDTNSAELAHLLHATKLLSDFCSVLKKRDQNPLTLFSVDKALMAGEGDAPDSFISLVICAIGRWDCWKYTVFKSPVSISKHSHIDQASPFFQQSDCSSIFTSVTVSSHQGLAFEITDIYKRTSGSLGDSTSGIRMDFKTITLHFHNKHIGAIAIHIKINTVLGQDTIGC
jgi:hypothetical protein